MDRREAKIYLELLLQLKDQYGDLNSALVQVFFAAEGSHRSQQRTADRLGVNKSVVQRSIRDQEKRKQSVSNQNTT